MSDELPRGLALPLVHPDVLAWLRQGLTEGWWADLTAEQVVNHLHDEFSRGITEAIAANDDPSTNRDLRSEPDSDDRAQLLAQRYMEATIAAFKAIDEEVASEEDPPPNVTIVLGYAPDGRIALASTEPEPYILMSLYAGMGSIQRAFRLRGERN